MAVDLLFRSLHEFSKKQLNVKKLNVIQNWKKMRLSLTASIQCESGPTIWFVVVVVVGQVV